MLILLGFNLAIGLPLNVFPCLLDGLGRFPAKTAIRTAGLLLRTGFFLVVLWNQGGLIALAWAITACNILEHVALAAAARTRAEALPWSAHLDRVESFLRDVAHG